MFVRGCIWADQKSCLSHPTDYSHACNSTMYGYCQLSKSNGTTFYTVPYLSVS